MMYTADMLLEIHDTVRRPKGHVKMTLRDRNGREAVHEYDNLVVDAGLTAVAAANVDPTASSRISYAEVGTGTNAPAAGDVALQTSNTRKAVSSWGAGTKQATSTIWFDYSEANAALKEAGLFIGGTITPGSGTLFSRVAVNVTKTNVQTLTIEWTIDWSDV